MFKRPHLDDNVSMAQESFSGRAPLVVGVLPGQHLHILHTVRSLVDQLDSPVVFAYVDEASYLVEWDPSKRTHRLSLHPERDDEAVTSIRAELTDAITADIGSRPVDWTLRILAGDPARALGRLAADVNASMIVVGTPERGLAHRISEALNGSVASWLSHHQSRPVLIIPTPKHRTHTADSLEPDERGRSSRPGSGSDSSGDEASGGAPTTPGDAPD